MALSEHDKQVIYRSSLDTVKAARLALQNDLHECLTAFAGELQSVMRPLVDEVTALRAEIESLKSGINDAAQQIRQADQQDPDSWWRGDAEIE